MNEDISPPPPVFPQYAPPNPQGIQYLNHPKQAKPLLKMINRMLHPKVKPRSPKVAKRTGRRKRDEL